MHGPDFDVTIENLSKIEGHTNLAVSVRGGMVSNVHLQINENKRFFTQAIRGKPAISAPQVLSRICGTCSIAHHMCCIEAVENAFGITPSDQTMLLRHLLMNGLMIRDHAMHLYLFCLPDVFGKDSILDFSDKGKEHELIHNAFDIKSVGNDVSTIVGGRAVHAPFPVVGGFIKLPEKESLRALLPRLRTVRDAAIEFTDIFLNCRFSLENNGAFVSLINRDYNFLGDELATSLGICIPEHRFADYLAKSVIPYSQAPGFKFEGMPYSVGALARMNLNGSSLRPETKKSLPKAISVFPSKNTFHNNLAQAVEVIHCIDASIAIIESFDPKPEPPAVVKPKAGSGVGVIEAPRGTLYYHLDVAQDGKVNRANLVIPTSQNQVKMEKDIGVLVNQCLKRRVPKDKIPLEIEKLIRAYDPCMSCATHFLKVKWG